jgi:hypothetical protein
MKARLRQLVSAVERAARSFGWGGVSNGLAVAGAGLVAWGAFGVYPPAGQIVAGFFLLAFAWLMARAA